MANKPSLQIVPHTCVDNFYSIAGGTPSTMRQLSNLVPTIDAVDEWVCRPAAVPMLGSTPAPPARFISAIIVVGTRVYGMTTSAAFAGFDQPFCFDILGSALIPVGGASGSNLPTSQPSTGAWSPPHMEFVGKYIVITHVGYSGTGSNFFGLIDTSVPATPTYSTSQIAVGTGGIVLPSVPIWVSQFNNRAYFLCNPTDAPPSAVFTDVNNPTTFFNGVTSLPYTNALTFGGNLELTCSATVAFDNQLGGQTQALVVFQGSNNMWQITGDPAATSNATTNISQGPFALNSLNVATGTIAPNTLCQTPKGLAFIAPDGLRLIDFQAHVSDPIGYGGSGICLPFFASTQPSRMVAACNATTIRISTINGSLINTPQQEWCFDISRNIWYGPHTFPVSLIAFYGTSFIISPIGIGGLWQSDLVPNSSSTYVENGAPIPCTWQSGYFPDRSGLEELSCTRSAFYQAYGAGSIVYTVSALDNNGNVLAGGPISIPFTGSTTTWGSFAWGYSVWLGSSVALAATQVPWTQPLVFDRVSISISVQASQGVRFGNFEMDIDEESYTVLSS